MPKVRPFVFAVKAAAACTAFIAAPALAEETHGEMVVTANRVETESDKVGSAVTVITAAQIERSQKTTVADLLRDVPGLSVSQPAVPDAPPPSASGAPRPITPSWSSTVSTCPTPARPSRPMTLAT